jgi:hypothetical protein
MTGGRGRRSDLESEEKRSNARSNAVQDGVIRMRGFERHTRRDI